MTAMLAPEQYTSVTSRDLIEGILRLLAVDSGPKMTAIYPPYRRTTLSSLEGLGKEIWEGVDPQQYVDRLRDEWNA